MPGESRVHCFSCSFSGTQTKLLMAMADAGLSLEFSTAMEAIIAAEEGAELNLAEGDYEASMFGTQLVEFPEDMVMATDPAYGPQWRHEVHPYLEQRLVSFETASHWDMRWDPFRQRVIFPIRDWDGVLRGLHGRSTRPETDLPYLAYTYQEQYNPSVWLGEHLVDVERTVLITESVFDLLRAFEVYPNVITPKTASVTAAQLKRIRGVSDAVTLFDADAAGTRARQAVSDIFHKRVRHVTLEPGTDAGDTAVEDLAVLLSEVMDLV